MNWTGATLFVFVVDDRTYSGRSGGVDDTSLWTGLCGSRTGGRDTYRSTGHLTRSLVRGLCVSRCMCRSVGLVEHQSKSFRPCYPIGNEIE